MSDEKSAAGDGSDMPARVASRIDPPGRRFPQPPALRSVGDRAPNVINVGCRQEAFSHASSAELFSDNPAPGDEVLQQSYPTWVHSSTRLKLDDEDLNGFRPLFL